MCVCVCGPLFSTDLQPSSTFLSLAVGFAWPSSMWLLFLFLVLTSLVGRTFLVNACRCTDSRFFFVVVVAATNTTKGDWVPRREVLSRQPIQPKEIGYHAVMEQ